MKIAHILLLWWLPTVVILGFIWLVTTHGLALEMAAVLLVLLMGWLQLVSVSYMALNYMPNHPYSFSKAITCPSLTIPSNGAVTYNSTADENGNYDFYVMATYNCDTGFFLVGDNSTTCTGNGSSITGTFDGLVPICEGKL